MFSDRHCRKALHPQVYFIVFDCAVALLHCHHLWVFFSFSEILQQLSLSLGENVLLGSGSCVSFTADVQHKT